MTQPGDETERGFSTSGSLLIIFFGTFLALGTMYTVLSNTTDEVSGAYDDQLETHNEIADTKIDVTAVYHESDGNLTVRADNVGAIDLTVEGTDVLVDGSYRSSGAFEISTVDGQDTDIWGKNQQLRLENSSTAPERVHLVTETGVTQTTAVEVVGLTNSNPRTLDRTGNTIDSTIAFDLNSSYSGTITLKSVTIESVDGANPSYINYENDPALSEVNVTLAPNHGTPVATADGNFTISERISHDNTTLEPDDKARYRIGEFRDSAGNPVAMPSTTVTITVTFEDPEGVERTVTFTEGDF
jgi:flagellar protein FlaF